MLCSTTLTRRLMTVGASALVSTAILGGGAIAQVATPQEEDSGGPSEGYPVAIHQGTCSDLSSEVAYEIGQAVTFGVTGGNEPETIGSEDGVTTVLLGVSADVDNALDTLGSEGHAIVVHASPDDDTVVACGNIAGASIDGELALAIAPTEGSNVVGVAILADNDGQTTTKVYLFQSDVDAEAAATPQS